MSLAKQELEDLEISDDEKLYEMVGMDEEKMKEVHEHRMAGLLHNDIERYAKYLSELERVSDLARGAGIKGGDSIESRTFHIIRDNCQLNQDIVQAVLKSSLSSTISQTIFSELN